MRPTKTSAQCIRWLSNRTTNKQTRVKNHFIFYFDHFIFHYRHQKECRVGKNQSCLAHLYENQFVWQFIGLLQKSDEMRTNIKAILNCFFTSTQVLSVLPINFQMECNNFAHFTVKWLPGGWCFNPATVVIITFMAQWTYAWAQQRNKVCYVYEHTKQVHVYRNIKTTGINIVAKLICVQQTKSNIRSIDSKRYVHEIR